MPFLVTFIRYFVTLLREATKATAQPNLFSAPPPSSLILRTAPFSVWDPVSIHACIQAIPTSTSSSCHLCPSSSLFHRPCLEVNSLQDFPQVPQGPLGFSPHPHHDLQIGSTPSELLWVIRKLTLPHFARFKTGSSLSQTGLELTILPQPLLVLQAYTVIPSNRLIPGACTCWPCYSYSPVCTFLLL